MVDDTQKVLENADGFYCDYCDLLDYEADCTCDGDEYDYLGMEWDAYEYDDGEFQKSNRQKVKSPKSNKKAWCDTCDRNYGPSTSVCGVCGNIMGGYSKKSRPMKKDSNAR